MAYLFRVEISDTWRRHWRSCKRIQLLGGCLAQRGAIDCPLSFIGLTSWKACEQLMPSSLERLAHLSRSAAQLRTRLARTRTTPATGERLPRLRREKRRTRDTSFPPT